jgi:hypothetical protein
MMTFHNNDVVNNLYWRKPLPWLQAKGEGCNICGQQKTQAASACCFNIFTFVILPSASGVPMC